MLRAFASLIGAAPKPPSDDEVTDPSLQTMYDCQSEDLDPVLTARPEESPVEHPADDVYHSSVYKIDGKDAELVYDNVLLVPRGGNPFLDEATKIDVHPADTPNKPPITTWHLDHVMTIRQYKAPTVQFVYLEKPDAPQGYELGLHLSNPQQASRFRSLLVNSIAAGSVELGKTTGLSYIYSAERGEYRPWLPSCTLVLTKRSAAHNHAILTVYQGDCPDSNDAPLIRTELSSDIQLSCRMENREFTWWGPFSKTSCDSSADDWNRTLFKFEVKSDEFLMGLLKCVGIQAKVLAKNMDTVFAGLEELDETEMDKDVSLDYSENSADDWYRQLHAENDTEGLVDSDLENIGLQAEKEKPTPLRTGGYRRHDSESSSESEGDGLDESSSSSDSSYSPVNRYRRKPNRVSITYDPTEDLVSKKPDARVHRFMKVGKSQGFVARSGAGDKDCSIDVYNNADYWNRGMSIGSSKLAYNGQKLIPDEGVLHDGETKLILANKGDPSSVYQLDIERETVVAKYNTGGLPAKILWNTEKGGETSHDPTVMAAGDQAFYMMDMRHQKGPALTKTYATRMNFTAAASDGSGHVALGNNRGELRLYDGDASDTTGQFKIAKTQLNCDQRDRLLAVDVTKDGSWVLGTMETYLVLFPVKLRGSGRTGFETRLGSEKPPGIRLQLKIEDIQKYQLQAVSFTSAVFDPSEKWIIAATGNYAVVWDFRMVKKGHPYAYRIRYLDHYIKGAKCINENSLVVAFPEEVKAVRQLQL